MNTCELNNPANKALIAATKAPLADLQTSQHRKMLITAQKLIATFDKYSSVKDSLLAEHIKDKFGDDIEALRGCIAHSQQLADYMVKVGAI